ncbi:MAG: MaoC family dehydratase N-terminal domain-containing protein [Actinobacteria bacterium]|nr:MaoC family dehydratase N-terminal domain-containing protein [Actinomycetota bacterium]
MKLFWEGYEIGSKRVSSGRTITETDIVLHAGQTGDFYPHHMDAEWCKTQVFGQRVAHGTLVLAVAVGSLAGEINEVAFSYGYDKVRFISPVFIGDTITAHAEIVAKREHPRNPEEFGIVDEQVSVLNQRGETVLAFVHVYMVEREEK